jgi:hypothetical protein
MSTKFYSENPKGRDHFQESESQSASLSWHKVPTWGLRPDLYYCLLRSCFCGGALSDERTSLSFVYATGPCQRSHSRVRVPWHSRPYITVSNFRLPFSSPSTTRRVTHHVGAFGLDRCYATKLLLSIHLRGNAFVAYGISRQRSAGIAFPWKYIFLSQPLPIHGRLMRHATISKQFLNKWGLRQWS